MLLTAITSLAQAALGMWGERAKAKHDMRLERIRAGVSMLQSSWADEFLICVWSGPLIIGWFDPELAESWFKVFDAAPDWYQIGWLSITGAVFAVPKLLDWNVKRKSK